MWIFIMKKMDSSHTPLIILTITFLESSLQLEYIIEKSIIQIKLTSEKKHEGTNRLNTDDSIESTFSVLH